MAEYTPIGQGTYNTVAGSVGLASALFGGNGGNLFGGLFGGSNNGVSKETFDLSMQLSASQRDNAILTAELNTEKKMVEVFNALNDKINKVVADQTAVNAQQAVYNCAANSSISVLQTQVAQLLGMTKTVIPNSSVCPGWGNATVSVTTTPATTA